jgi:hypothetical protein
MKTVILCLIAWCNAFSGHLSQKERLEQRGKLRMMTFISCLGSSNKAYDSLLIRDGSSAGVVELGKYSEDIVFMTIDSLGKKAGADVWSGKYGAPLDIMKCWEYVHSPKLDSVVKGFDRYLE